ncbi:hypothetical protein C8F01DRAFT_1333228 [Mycena amicta]|nr:hypothetical protein C8F01DRAFT_1333228 [Mycena amicta]
MTILNHSDSHIIPPLVNLFLAFQLTGAFGLVVIILTALLSKRVKRNATWYYFIISWILSCISYTLIFILGQQNEPSFGPCLVQAGAIYGAPVLTSCATLAFTIEDAVGRARSGGTAAHATPTLSHDHVAVVPFTVWLGIFISLIVFGVEHPSQVSQRTKRDDTCDFESISLSSLIAIMSTFVLLVIQRQATSRPRLIKNRNLLKDRQLTRMAVRVIIFSLLGALGLGIGVAYVLYSIPGSSFDVIMSTLPIGGVLIFGTQADLLEVWMFWRTPATPRKPLEDTKTSVIPEVPTPC